MTHSLPMGQLKQGRTWDRQTMVDLLIWRRDGVKHVSLDNSALPPSFYPGDARPERAKAKARYADASLADLEKGTRQALSELDAEAADAARPIDDIGWLKWLAFDGWDAHEAAALSLGLLPRHWIGSWAHVNAPFHEVAAKISARFEIVERAFDANLFGQLIDAELFVEFCLDRDLPIPSTLERSSQRGPTRQVLLEELDRLSAEVERLDTELGALNEALKPNERQMYLSMLEIVGGWALGLNYDPSKPQNACVTTMHNASARGGLTLSRKRFSDRVTDSVAFLAAGGRRALKPGRPSK